jgi:hypothetical protein
VEGVLNLCKFLEENRKEGRKKERKKEREQMCLFSF